VEAPAEDAAAGLALAREIIGRVEPHIELLLRACEAARIGIPGVGQEPYRHAPPPNAISLLKHLIAVLERRPELVREIQIAVFRFYDARATQEAIAPPVRADQLADLRRKVFYLTHYYSTLRGDPVLDQMFPPPQGRMGTAPLAPVSVAHAERSQTAGRKLEAAVLLERTAGWLPLLQLALEAVDDPARMMKLVLARDLKPARLLLLRMQGAPDAQALAREVLASWQALDVALSNDSDGLDATAQRHAETSSRCLAHPLLGDLLQALPGRV
jgi:hypothetical protein